MLSSPTTYVPSLTGLRFVAALGVVACHMSLLGVIRDQEFTRFSAFGFLGVGFFFVLSGFVLAWVAKDADTPLSFCRRRFARVYPLYLALLGPGSVLALLGLLEVSGLATVLSVLLLQSWSPSLEYIELTPNLPGWSLSVEAFLYLMFPVLGWRLIRWDTRRLYMAGAVILLVMVSVAVVAQAAMSPSAAKVLTYFFPPFRLGDFLLGVILATLVSRRAIRLPPLSAACAAAIASVALLALVFPGVYPGVASVAMLPLFLLVIGAAADADLRRRSSPFRGRTMVTLGAWSYALYLVHFPALLIWTTAGGPSLSSNRLLAAGEFVVAVGVLVLLSGAAHRLIEQPAERRLRARWRAPAPASPAETVAGPAQMAGAHGSGR